MSTQTDTGAPAARRGHAPPPEEYSNRYLWYTVAILTLASTMSIIDRQVLNVMIGPVKRDLGGLTDLQVSLVMGLAFAAVYNLASFPAGRLSDRANRRNIMAGGITAWSVATAACGMANTYWQLFLARMGVGLGEATLGPAANSTLADLFDRARLPLAIGIVSSAPFVGQGLAGMVGGPLIDYLEEVPNVQAPVLGDIYSWQMVFLLCAVPGLILGGLYFTLYEPRRKGRATDRDGSIPWLDVWRFVRSRGMFFTLIFTGYLCLSTQGWSLLFWIYEFFLRTHDWSMTKTGLTYGPLAMIVGICGSVWAGFKAGRMISQGRRDATLRLVFYSTCGLIPTAVALTLVPSPWMAIALLFPVTFLMAMPPGLIMTSLQTIAPNELRGQMVAFYLIVVNFLSYTFAPSLPPLMDRLIFGQEHTLGVSISILAAFNYTVGAICLGLGLKYYRRALDAARAWSG